MGKTTAAKSIDKTPAETEARPCHALGLLRAKVREDRFAESGRVSVSKLARDLDKSWTYASSILDGSTRPDVDDVAVLRDEYGIPAESWRQW